MTFLTSFAQKSSKYVKNVDCIVEKKISAEVIWDIVRWLKVCASQDGKYIFGESKVLSEGIQHPQRKSKKTVKVHEHVIDVWI